MSTLIKNFVVWSGLNSKETHYFTDKCVTRMTTDFSDAMIFDSDHSFWMLANDPKVGRFKVHQAPATDIMKWKLQNRVPSDRL